VHITGSDATYDALVWGCAKKRPGVAPPFKKAVTAELGCVTPYVLVPGEWSDDDIEAKAAMVVAMVGSNASCNCLAPKVLVLARTWPQREQFLEALRRRFAAAAPRAAYYPGAAAKYDAFAKAYAAAEQLGEVDAAASAAAGVRRLPWMLLRAGPLVRGEKALTEEAWSPVLAVRARCDARAFVHCAKLALNSLPASLLTGA
jgi:hypothetical protein